MRALLHLSNLSRNEQLVASKCWSQISRRMYSMADGQNQDGLQVEFEEWSRVLEMHLKE